MIALFLRRWWPLLLIGGIALGLTAGFVVWLHAHDAATDARARRGERLVARDTVIQWRTDTAAARTAERRVDSVTVQQILTRVRTDTLWRRDTVHVAGDTTSRVAIPLGVLLQHDSAFAACDRLNRSCAREHTADSLVILELRQSLALARTGVVVPPHTSWRERALWAGLGALAGHSLR